MTGTDDTTGQGPADPQVRGNDGLPPPGGALEPGLHIVATPIGAARDITLRAIDILAGADLLLAEDTRTLRRLMEIHGLRLGGRPLWAYHDHSGARLRPGVLAALDQGRSVALVSDAGTPLVADPGYQLVAAAIAAGHPVRAAPGASAVLAALTVAGLPTDRFAFLGFAPVAHGARGRFLAEALGLPMTVVIYESPRRIHRLLTEIAERDGQRPVALCRELTKKFEEVIRGPVESVATAIADRELKGEIVLVLGPPGEGPAVAESDLDAALLAEMSEARLRVAVDVVANRLGLPRRLVYQRALTLQAEDTSGAEGGTEDGADDAQT